MTTPTPRATPRAATGQAKAPATQPIAAAAFEPTGGTVLRWLGMAGFLITSRGTTLMIDPVLEGFDMPLLIDLPMEAGAVPRLDAVLVTHSDNDHYSVPTCRALVGVTGAYHSTGHVASLMTGHGLPGHGHGIGDAFTVGPVRVELTPADHAWQNSPRSATRARSSLRTPAGSGSPPPTERSGRPGTPG